jgi:hypothetical protein
LFVCCGTVERRPGTSGSAMEFYSLQKNMAFDTNDADNGKNVGMKNDDPKTYPVTYGLAVNGFKISIF